MNSDGMSEDDIEITMYELSSVSVEDLMHGAYEHQDPESMCALGFLYENGLNGLAENKEEAFRLYCMAADLGEANGIYNKGVCLGFGVGTGKSRDAQGWLENIRRAAEMGFAPAQNDYGWAWEMAKERGFFPYKDDTEAFGWYMESALQGHQTGIENVVRCFEEGIGTEKDSEKAEYWRRKLHV